MAQRNGPVPGEFPKWLQATPPIDGSGYALRQQQPLRNIIAVPCVVDDFDRLVQHIALYYLRFHSIPSHCITWI